MRVGNLAIKRDWGWAPEYVEAMFLMLQQDQPEDFVIATGKSHSLETFLAMVFEVLGLSWKDRVVVDESLYRPSEILEGKGRPDKAMTKLGWRAATDLSGVVRGMLSGDEAPSQ